jgi:hypothetical protein
MSCNCNAKYDNKIPCCCSTGTAVVCTTTQCPNTQPCNETVETNCVLYNKEHDCIGITSGMTVTEVVNIILDKVNLIDCTTTIAPTCGCYLLINNSGSSKQYEYDTCEDTDHRIETLQSNQRIYICSSTIPSADTGIVVGTLSNLNCSLDESTCISPNSYCHTISVTGTTTFQYINVSSILTTITITNTSTQICAWQKSIDKISGSDVYTITPSNTVCLPPFGIC